MEANSKAKLAVLIYMKNDLEEQKQKIETKLAEIEKERQKLMGV